MGNCFYLESPQGLEDFCRLANKNNRPFKVSLYEKKLNLETIEEWRGLNAARMEEGVIGPSHLQQGIKYLTITERNGVSGVRIVQKPFLYPSERLVTEFPHLTGPMTGNLSNCYDPIGKFFLFHLRGRSVTAPFGIQAASAGMGVYGQHPGVTAALELGQEAGLENAIQFAYGRAIQVLPFQKPAGTAGIVLQPLFSFGFIDDLSRFANDLADFDYMANIAAKTTERKGPLLNSIDEIAEFESNIKRALTQDNRKPEAANFTIQLEKVEKIVGELKDKKRFYGPIAQSHISFHRALRNSGYLA